MLQYFFLQQHCQDQSIRVMKELNYIHYQTNLASLLFKYVPWFKCIMWYFYIYYHIPLQHKFIAEGTWIFQQSSYNLIMINIEIYEMKSHFAINLYNLNLNQGPLPTKLSPFAKKKYNLRSRSIIYSGFFLFKKYNVKSHYSIVDWQTFHSKV